MSGIYGNSSVDRFRENELDKHLNEKYNENCVTTPYHKNPYIEIHRDYIEGALIDKGDKTIEESGENVSFNSEEEFINWIESLDTDILEDIFIHVFNRHGNM